MVAYLLKFILCSGFLYLFYKLFLERESMYKINRFYLIFALLFSVFAPLYQIEIPAVASEQLTLTPELIAYLQNNEQFIAESEVSMNWLNIFLGIYGIIGGILFLKFALNLFHLVMIIRKNPTEKNRKIVFVLLQGEGQPFSFFHYIFLNKNQHESLHQNILLHEKAHAMQKHTLDILFIEILSILFWFNPLVYYYKKSIKLNHEFLADEYVLQFQSDVKSYQYQILDYLAKPTVSGLTSNLNFILTKKRLLMMTKKTSNRKIGFLSVSALPFFFMAFILFSQKNFAQKIDSASVKIEQTLEKPIKNSIAISSDEEVILVENTDSIISKLMNDKDIKKLELTSDNDVKFLVVNDSLKIDLNDPKYKNVTIIKKSDNAIYSESNKKLLDKISPKDIKTVTVKMDKDQNRVMIINDTLKIQTMPNANTGKVYSYSYSYSNSNNNMPNKVPDSIYINGKKTKISDLRELKLEELDLAKNSKMLKDLQEMNKNQSLSLENLQKLGDVKYGYEYIYKNDKNTDPKKIIEQSKKEIEQNKKNIEQAKLEIEQAEKDLKKQLKDIQKTKKEIKRNSK